jgi:AcrR family transcriptional regulator
MPRAALTQPEIEAFRDEIIRAASRLFAERGYEAVTMRSLAAELGCSPMTPYRYFDGKDEIFAMVKADAYRRFADAEEGAAATAADPAARLTVLARAYVDFALAEPDAYRIMFELAQAADDAYPEVQAQARRAWGALRDAVGAAVAAGLIAGDADDVAHLYWAQVHGLVALHLAGKLTLGRTLEELLQALLDQNARGRRPSC